MANWQEDELLLTLHLYCRTAFGKLHNRNPDVIQLANAIGRTASAVALKATNLASHITPLGPPNKNSAQTQPPALPIKNRSSGFQYSLKREKV